MSLHRFQVDFSLRTNPEHARWAGILEELPYANRGRHRYVLHLPRLLAILALLGGAGFVILISGKWFVQYRPLGAEVTPWQVAVMQWSVPARAQAAAQLTAKAGQEAATQSVWHAHDLYVRALDLDPSNQAARLGLARQLEHEGFRPQSLNLLITGLALPAPSAEYLQYTGERLLAAGEQATLTRLLPPAFRQLRPGTPSTQRRSLTQLVVQAYLDQSLHAQAIAFAREAGFEDDSTLGATRLHVRELIDRGRFSEATQLIGDVRSKGSPSPATALLFMEASIGKGDLAAALEVARGMAGVKLSLDEQLSLLQQLHRIIVQEGSPDPKKPNRPAPESSSAHVPGSAAELYHQVVQALLGDQPALATVARLAGMLADAPDSATLQEFAPRMQGEPVRRRLWLSAQVDALMAEGECRQALALYLDQLGGKLQQSDDSGASAQSALLYYLNYSSAPLVDELGRILAQRAAASSTYARAARILLGNHRWEGAHRIATLGLGLFPGNNELRLLQDQATQGKAKQNSADSIAAYTGERPDQISLDDTLRQGETHLADRNDSAVLSLLQQVERQHPQWLSEAAESLAWLRVRAVLTGGHPYLAVAAAGDYIGNDPARARRLFDWLANRTGEGETAGWLAPLARLFQQRFPNLPPLDRWGVARAGDNPAELLTEFDRLVAEGRLADARALLDAIHSEMGLDPGRRADVAQRRLTLAVARGHAEETTQLATELIRLDPKRGNQVVLLAERQALLALELARAAQNLAPDALRQSPLLLAMQASTTAPVATAAPTPQELLQHAQALLLDGHFADAEQLYRQCLRDHPELPEETKGLGTILGTCFSLATLQPQQAAQVAATICQYQPTGPALAAALLNHHRSAQNAIPVQALQSALNSIHESH